MSAFPSRAARWPLALMLAALGACADEPAPTQSASSPRLSQSAAGDVITVTNNSGGTAPGSLRWALAQTTGGETIRFDPRLAGDSILLDSTLMVKKFVTIEGAKDRGIVISGNGRVRVMNVYEGATLRNVTVERGRSDGIAGIYAAGPLTLEHSTVWLNYALNGTGGIYANDITLVNSTVARNTGIYGGPASGIAFPTNGKLTMINSTVTENTFQPGINTFGSTSYIPVITVRNSLIAKNGLRADGFGNCGMNWAFTWQGMNVVDDDTCGAYVPGVRLVADARVDFVNYRGGPTPTVEILRDSPALDAGVDCTVAVDQRYVPRGTRCDVGAFEFTDFITVAITIDPTHRVNPDGSAVITGTVRCSANAYVPLLVDLKQALKGGRPPVQASNGDRIDCTTTAKPWSAYIVTELGTFAKGAATVAVNTFDTAQWVTPASTASAVKLVNR